MIVGRTVHSVVLDNPLYDKGLFIISGTHLIIIELIKDYRPIRIRDLSLSYPIGIQIGINLLPIMGGYGLGQSLAQKSNKSK